MLILRFFTLSIQVDCDSATAPFTLFINIIVFLVFTSFSMLLLLLASVVLIYACMHVFVSVCARTRQHFRADVNGCCHFQRIREQFHRISCFMRIQHEVSYRLSVSN